MIRRRELSAAARCRRATIFCGGRKFYPAARLCKNCYERARQRRRRGWRVARAATFSLIRAHGRDARRRRNGARLEIRFPAGLFAARRKVSVSYARWLWEKVTRAPLARGLVVVNVSRKLRPDFEDLLVVSRGYAERDAEVGAELAARDARTEQRATPF